jgi:glycosyltransferase involved in cell wall biosynthesis
VDEAVFRPTEVAHSAEVTRLVSIGRLHPSKGQPILLMALLKLIERGMPVHLELIGGGADRTRLEGIIVKQGIEQHVTLHGPLSHIATRNILQQADIFVLSSFAEGVPVALMEAMASEVACVSTFVAGVPELISSTSEGLLVPPASVDKLAEALEVLIHDPVRRQAIATAGRSKVLADYNLSRNADHLANVFRSYGLGTLQC